MESAKQRQFYVPLLLFFLQFAFGHCPSNVLPIHQFIQLLLVGIVFPKLVYVVLASVVYHPKFRSSPTNAILLAALETEVGLELEQGWYDH